MKLGKILSFVIIATVVASGSAIAAPHHNNHNNKHPKPIMVHKNIAQRPSNQKTIIVNNVRPAPRPVVIHKKDNKHQHSYYNGHKNCYSNCKSDTTATLVTLGIVGAAGLLYALAN